MISLGHADPGFIIFLPILFFLLFNVLNIVLAIWAYRDARKRGNSKEYAIIGLVIYLVIRKD